MELSNVMKWVILKMTIGTHLFGCIWSDQTTGSELDKLSYPASPRGTSPITDALDSDLASAHEVLGKHFSESPSGEVGSRKAIMRRRSDSLNDAVFNNDSESPAREVMEHPGTLSPGLPRSLRSRNSDHVRENMPMYLGTVVIVCVVGVAFVCAVIANERSNSVQTRAGRANIKRANRSSVDCPVKKNLDQSTEVETQDNQSCQKRDDSSKADNVHLSIVADTYTGPVSPSQLERSNSVDLGHQPVAQTDIW